ncbi:hypothetical protein BGW39_001042 [Mortierella sp. 14UC]|nr:hypothetical protein BGW39_001042 [Mortierella sp. 14UC]
MEANWGSKLGLIADSTLVTVFERNRCRTNGLSSASQDKTIEKNMPRLREGLQQLEAELSQAEQEGSVPSKELASREDTLIKLQQQLEKLEALLQDKDDADARAVLLGLNQNSSRHSRSKIVRFSEHEVEVDNLDNSQMLQLHQRIMDDQDQNLDRLSNSLGRQQEIGLTINEELESQVGMLDDTEHLVDRTENRISIASRQLVKVAKGTKGCENQTTMSSASLIQNNSLNHLLPPNWKTKITEWLQEDIPSFDYGGYVVGEKETTAILFGKSEGIVAGVPFFTEIFEQLGCRVEWHVKEGDVLKPIQTCAHVYGPVRQILIGERTALNMMARCSGIASQAHRLRILKEKNGFKGVIAGTRKTTPGFRLVEKYGMLVGGADTHRMDLSSMIMLKDNHVWSTGSITAAVQKAKAVGGFALKIEVECRSEEEADEAIAAGADIVMLDNYEGDALKAAAGNIKQRWAAKGRQVLVECSGGVTEQNIESYFCDAIDIISLGSMTQGVSFVDFSLKVQKNA